MAQTGREQTDPISSGEDRRQMRLDVRILWNSPGKNVKLAPKKITCLNRRWLEFHFARSRPVPGEKLLIHYSSCIFGTGPSSRTDVGAQRPAHPTGQPQLSTWASARPAPPLWLSLGRGDPGSLLLRGAQAPGGGEAWSRRGGWGTRPWLPFSWLPVWGQVHHVTGASEDDAVAVHGER